jgi:hypothetical protein
MPEGEVAKFSVRLNVRDVEEMKRRAKQSGATWNGYLRALIGRALIAERKGKVIA